MALDPRAAEAKRDQELREYLAYMQQVQAMQNQQMQNAWGNGLLGGAGGLGSLGALQNAVGIYTPPTPKPPVDAKVIDALKAAEPRMVTAKMPDSLTPITAWRAWGITLEGSEYRLKALGQTSIWQPKKKLEAFCAKGGSSHPAPHFSCECGVWCFKTLEQLLPALEGYTVPILGNVSIWGRIIETDKGFRAQYAYPKELWLLDKAHEHIGYIYGVPVRSA